MSTITQFVGSNDGDHQVAGQQVADQEALEEITIIAITVLDR